MDAAPTLDADAVRVWIGQLAGTGSITEDAKRIELIGELETLTRAAAAAQAALSADFDASQRQQQADAGVRPGRRHRGIADQIALARKESPHRGRQHLGLAKVLVAEMPHTWAAFRAGRITEYRATALVRETACLSLEDRQTVDHAVAGDPDALEGYSDRVVEAEVRKLAARLDARSVAKRRRRAESERRVTVRPAPDVMTYVTALLPVAQGVAVYAALKAEADRLVASGDPRSRGQIMPDTLVGRVTGAPSIDGRPVVPVTIDLVMTDRALFAGATDSAQVAGFGAIPAEVARGLVADLLDAGTATWLRRLYTSPATGELVAMDARSRRFPGSSGTSSIFATSSAARRGATHRSGTETTSSQWRTVARRAPWAGRGSARAATTRSRRPAGERDRGRVPATWSRPGRRLDSPTARPHHLRWLLATRHSSSVVPAGGS
ncbi:hypothetical protein GCM10009844_17650 [Nocardioides koreensis]|uniref:DUF222 domain-containing protein n=1 Tax=Nocardioides koreensis TaxID=433651 RepID=A0ABN2ZM21_9ACTN